MEGIFVLLNLFQYVIGLVIANILGWNESLVLRFIAVFCLLFSIYEFVKNWREIKKTDNHNSIFLFLFLYTFILFSILPQIAINGNFNLVSGEILSFGTRALSGLLMSFWLTQEKFKNKVVKWIVPLVIFLTTALLIVVLKNRVNLNRPNSATFMEVGRQTVAYGGAYSIGFILLTKSSDDIKTNMFKVFRGLLWGILSWVFIAVDFYIILASEGRGAFILVIILFLLFGFYKLFNKRLTIKTLLKGLFLFLTIIFGTIAIFSISGKGANILFLLQNGISDRSSSERLVLYQKAFEISKNRHFIGFGATSVVYSIGFYSHNIIVDILCDFGIIGIFAFACLLINALSSIYKGRKNYFVQFSSFIFVFSFTMLLFSGSYMSDSMIWFGIPSLILLKNSKKRFSTLSKFNYYERKEVSI